MKSDPHLLTSSELVSFRRKPAGIDAKSIEDFAEAVRQRVLRNREFHCLITGDAELKRLNAQFRGKDEATDVLSFPQEGTRGYAGDLAISLARARAQAKQFGHPVETEIRILMLHGALHLKGMDHETDSGQMARTEMKWRKEFDLPAALIERAT